MGFYGKMRITSQNVPILTVAVDTRIWIECIGFNKLPAISLWYIMPGTIGVCLGWNEPRIFNLFRFNKIVSRRYINEWRS